MEVVVLLLIVSCVLAAFVLCSMFLWKERKFRHGNYHCNDCGLAFLWRTKELKLTNCPKCGKPLTSYNLKND